MSRNEIKVFNNVEFGEVRTAIYNSEPVFCLADVCRVLDIANSGNVKNRLNEKGICTMDTLTSGGMQKMIFITESNLYKVIFQSRKPEAEKFSDWVTSEVLPSIRKHGMYAVELSLYTGMRVGELSGLKWEDINYEEQSITICRSEKYNRKKNEFYISTTKNDKVRTFPLTSEIKDVLDRVKKEEIKRGFLTEFVFSDVDGRVHARKISECIRNMTMTKEFEHTKSIHAIRRTLNSNLRSNGVPVTVAAALLGHTERVNEENYTYDVSSIHEKMKIIEAAGKIS